MKKNELKAMRVDAETLKILKRIAQREGRTIAKQITVIVREWCEQRDRNKSVAEAG